MCEVALVVGADTTPKGFLAPNAGERWDDPDWLRFRLLGMTNPAYFALYARRRMDLYGATAEDFAAVKVKNARHGLENPNARYRKEVGVDDVLGVADGGRPAAPARHLRHLRRRRCGGADLDGLRPPPRPAPTPVRVRAVSTVTPTFPNTVIDMPMLSHRPGRRGRAPASRPSSSRSAPRRTRRPASDPDDVEPGRGLRPVHRARARLDRGHRPVQAGRGRAAAARRATPRIGGRIPVNPAGGLACFGEAVPAQALAQVCEVTWQLRGQAEGRQVEGATVGITANQGLFGHGSSVLLST